MLVALLWALPVAAQTPLQQRADSLTATFWDTFFTQADSVCLRSAEAKATHTAIETEQRVVDFLALLPHATDGGRQVFITGHSEYSHDTLQKEYLRDKGQGLNPKLPERYFPNDDDTKTPLVTWRSHANLLYQNWLNYYVYQTTPYDINAIEPMA